jgi:hypothetical protein
MTTLTRAVTLPCTAGPMLRIARSRAQSKSLVEQFNTSGVTHTAVCKHHGITDSGF